MYGALLPVTGIAIGLYLVVAIIVVVVGSLFKLSGGRGEKS
jgi:hypothetical protein